MSNGLQRGLAILESLTGEANGLQLHTIAEAIGAPRSAVHRLLGTLCEQGYVEQEHAAGSYRLSLKAVSLALRHLSQSGLVDIAQPIMDRLAEHSGELVRLSIVDGERLVWVAKAQGCRSGLRYDPESGAEARLSCSASGIAWLSCMSDAEALGRVRRQGFGQPADFGPRAPVTEQELLVRLQRARTDGYARVEETFEAGTAALAAPICRQRGAPIGVLSIGGPSVRLPEPRMEELAPALLHASRELADLRLALAPPLALVH
ncbi:MAG: IclR family transcriptional regulator [Pseudomonas sp.]|jgi:DNA-binding IclR family transcriptional regulator|nr:IclR family transcriptional regulator [Pseudomonadales bacterium]MAK86846.1 IclR family transcriptional regulator [Pseudomonas sp.]|tara:strand:- start:4246 stop:5031 length:786 start_codon:yes stop_codon:yes gene_type:complete